MGDDRKREIERHGGRAVDYDSLSPAEILAAAKSYTDQGREPPRILRARRIKEHLENPPELPPDIPKLPRNWS